MCADGRRPPSFHWPQRRGATCAILLSPRPPASVFPSNITSPWSLEASRDVRNRWSSDQYRLTFTPFFFFCICGFLGAASVRVRITQTWELKYRLCVRISLDIRCIYALYKVFSCAKVVEVSTSLEAHFWTEDHFLYPRGEKWSNWRQRESVRARSPECWECASHLPLTHCFRWLIVVEVNDSGANMCFRCLTGASVRSWAATAAPGCWSRRPSEGAGLGSSLPGSSPQ